MVSVLPKHLALIFCVVLCDPDYTVPTPRVGLFLNRCFHFGNREKSKFWKLWPLKNFPEHCNIVGLRSFEGVIELVHIYTCCL